MAVPTKWAVVEVRWGEGKKHLYCPDRESFRFYREHDEALNAARTAIEDDDMGMVAILKVTSVFERSRNIVPVEVD